MANKTEALGKRRSAAIPQAPSNTTPYFAASAKGALIWDVDGREFIDFAGGIGVMNVGHCHPKVVAAIKDQAEKLLHTCFHVVMYEPYVELAEKLCRLAPGNFPKTALFVSTGAETVENAVKAARYYTKRQAIISLEHAFHGRTLLAMSLTSKVKPYKFGFGPFAPETYRMPAPYCYRCSFGLKYPSCGVACAEFLNEFFVEYVAAENTAAVIIEPVMGEGGFIVPPPEYLPKVAAICKGNGIVFIADEVQSGIGRTGKMFAVEHYGVEPDLMTTAKSLGGGMPLGAVVGREEILGSVHVGGLGGTYGGNPVACRAGLAVLEAFEEENLLAKGQALGEKLRRRFDEWAGRYEIIGEVRGLGPMIALELVQDRQSRKPGTDDAKALSRYCQDRGLIILTCGAYGNVIRVLAPLVITDEQLEKGLSIMEEGFESIKK